MKETYAIEDWVEDNHFFLEREGDILTLAHTIEVNGKEVDTEVILTENQVIDLMVVMTKWLSDKRG